jgi:UDP-2,3-diacylglucosamine pyrophosphatase LpxH
VIARTIDIPYKYGDTFKLLPLADIHFGHKTCDKQKLRQDLKEKVDEQTIIIGLGDWFDMLIVKDAKRYRKAHDDTEGEAIIDEQIEGLADLLMPYKNNIYAVGDGNHEDTMIALGTNPIKRLIKLLSDKEHVIEYMGYTWLLNLQFRETQGRGRGLIIRGHHGWGGSSRTEGADITKYSHDVKFWQADLFLYGHVHKLKFNLIEEGRMIGKDKWKTYQKKMCVCGTYQRTYSNNTSATYAERSGFHPTSIQCPVIYLKPHHDNGVDVKVLS